VPIGAFSAQRTSSTAKEPASNSCASRSALVKGQLTHASHEKSPAFKDGQRFRAAIEGRISVLFRGCVMEQCLAEGRERFELLVGAAVLANNLMVIARLLLEKQNRRRRRTA